MHNFKSLLSFFIPKNIKPETINLVLNVVGCLLFTKLRETFQPKEIKTAIRRI